MRLIVLTIRVRNIALGIVEESENMVKIKSNCAGQVNESLTQEVITILWKLSITLTVVQSISQF